MRFFTALAMMLLALQGCGGGGSDSAAPPPVVIQAGDFELIAGTLDFTAPAGAARCQSRLAIGADLGSDGMALSMTVLAIGASGHLYLLTRACDPNGATLALIEIDPATGLMQVQPVPFDPRPTRSPDYPYAYLEPTLTKVFDPTSMAVASDGAVLIGDGYLSDITIVGPIPNRAQPGYGRGIWRFKDGALSKVAGFDLGSSDTSLDGKGGQATFASLDHLCTGANGILYVNDKRAALRKVMPDGTVETLTRTASRAAARLICATNQRAFGGYAAPDNQLFLGDLASDQMFGPSDISPYWLRGIYGFGDGLLIASAENDASLLSIVSSKTGETSAPWIRASADAPSFQLTSKPYAIPNPQIVIGNDNMAYLLSGNALLRYKLPDRVQ